ncbi:hypothetical protein L1987_31567 [Smallanthus sonchifolius]|uniref:Uncharacterized protein n=1 Tax=Smallanthus sonchifolius TaxID=185202 RepID=A0ACB9I7C4_9ASTR|nr:hypothetical protein L1987_31567 [Smallanthus sonchifolius]
MMTNEKDFQLIDPLWTLVVDYSFSYLSSSSYDSCFLLRPYLSLCYYIRPCKRPDSYKTNFSTRVLPLFTKTSFPPFSFTFYGETVRLDHYRLLLSRCSCTVQGNGLQASDIEKLWGSYLRRKWRKNYRHRERGANKDIETTPGSFKSQQPHKGFPSFLQNQEGDE